MKLKEIMGIDKIDTSNAESLRGMFYGCNNITNLDVSFFDTSKVKSFNGMFWLCSSITNEFNLTNWNIENGEDFGSMFFGCNSPKIIMPGKNSKAKGVGAMFQGCGAQKIDISGIDTTNVTALNCTFHGCSNLKYLDISNFNFKNITDWSHYLGYLMPGSIVIYVKDQESKNYLIDHKPNDLKVENIIIR